MIEKINSYRKKEEQNKLIKTMLDLKFEVEGYTGKRIDINKQLDRIENEIKNNGGKLKKNEMKSLRKIIKDKEKRSNHKSIYMAYCLEHNLEYDSEEESLLFIAKYGHEKSKDEEISVPLRVTIGVTVALCGLFLFFVPIPICKTWAPELMKAGIALAVEGTINRVENDDRKNRKNASPA